MRGEYPMRSMPVRRAFIALLAIAATLLMGLALTQSVAPRAVRASGQELDPSYANGKLVYMIGPHTITNPNPNLLAQARELYILAFPEDTSCAPNCGPVTLPSGYHPLCNPCFHPGLPIPFVYHDHVLTGAPGFGNDGTAGSFKGPWQIIVMLYNPDFAFSKSFTPVTSDEALDAAEAAGEFLPINRGAANPYEIATGTVLICPLVSSHA
jgi:hypothetical protein